jgi:hypothetical protein
MLSTDGDQVGAESYPGLRVVSVFRLVQRLFVTITKRGTKYGENRMDRMSWTVSGNQKGIFANSLC